MAATLSITELQVFISLQKFIQSILAPGIEVIIAQGNRVSEPRIDNFVMMTPMKRDRLATNISTYDIDQKTTSVEQKTQVGAQVDIHGPDSADNSQIFTTLFRDFYGVQFFEDLGYGVVPLYCDDAKQMPFINGEEQYEYRWVMGAQMQVNPLVTLPQEFFNTINIQLIEVDANYPPV